MKTEFLNMREVAEMLNVHPVTVNRYCAQKKLTFYQIGSRKRFKQEDITKFIEGVKHESGQTSKDPFHTN